MSVLQISLIFLAVAAVGGVGLYNWLQELKYRKQWTETFGRQVKPGAESVKEPIDDESWGEPVLVETARVWEADEREVKNHAFSPGLTDVSGGRAVLDDHSVAPAAAQYFTQPAEPAPLEPLTASRVSTDIPVMQADLPPAPEEDLLETAISVHMGDLVPSTAFTTLIETQRAENRVARWLGFAEDQDKWIEISPWRNQSFTDVVVAVQLADRQGAVSESALHALIDALRQLAGRFKGVVSHEDLASVLARAAQIDRFCMEVDVLIGLNVVSSDGRVFSGETLNELALNAGLMLDATGVFQRRTERGETLYTLCNHEEVPFTPEQMGALTTHGVTLLFEVPRIDNGVVVFAEMARLGQQLAQALGGRLVDDNIRTLSPAGIEKIQTQLVHIYQQMEVFEIPAGSRRAMRLFN